MKIRLLMIIGLLVIAGALTVAPVMAGSTGSTTVSANPAASIDITVGGDMSYWPLVVGTNTNSSVVTLTVSANTVPWHVNVKDDMAGKPSGTGGFMVAYNSTNGYWNSAAPVLGYPSNPLEMTGGSGTGATAATIFGLTGNDQALETGNAVVNAQSYGNPTFTQVVTYNDRVLTGTGDWYRIVVDFTGTPS
jgi:hypothetical protein